jgi:glycosyltransferase involved in cell wall biosynthesis
MKLCIITRKIAKGDGQGRANYEIVCEAVRCGHKVTLVTNSVAPELLENEQINWIHVPIKGWPIELLREITFSRLSAIWLRKHRREFDLIQAYGAVTSAQADVNTVQFVHSGWLKSPVHPWRLRQDVNGAYQWLYTILNSYWEKKAFRQAKMVIAVSEKIEKELLEIGVRKDRIRVILNGADLKEFSPGFIERSQLGLPEGVTLAFFAGDIRSQRKNLDTVLHALVQVSGLHLAVAGSTERSPYPSLALELGLSERVHFLGFRHDISEIMKAVDLFVFPSRYEACTLVLLEAMATGLPVITADTAGGAEIVTPACGVVLSNSEDRPTLAGALITLAGDPDLRSRMGQASRSVAEEHSWVSKAQRYVELFEELVKEDKMQR